MISLVIPAFQAKSYIKECVDSIVIQCDDYEIIVAVDGCKTTLEYLKTIKTLYEPNLRILWLPKNRGTYVALNSAIRKAKGDEIMIVGADDKLLLGAVDKLRGLDQEYIRYGYQNFKDDEVVEIKKKPSGISWGGCYFKKYVFKKLNGFRDWQVAGDREFATRAEKIVDIYILNEIFYLRRIHESNITRSKQYGMQSEHRLKLHAEIDKTAIGKAYRNKKMVYQEAKEIKHSQIDISVCLPIYKMSNIVETAFEGLSRQITCFGWELIVIQDDDEPLNLNDWEHKLKKAGCIKTRFIKLSEKISLGKKMEMFSQLASGKAVVIQDADDYPHSNRLGDTYDAIIKKKHDFYNEQYGFFYDFKSRKTIFYDALKGNHPTGLNKAYKTSLFLDVPETICSIERSIDKFLFKTLQPKKIFLNKNIYKDSIFTDGYNKLSLTRAKFYKKPIHPFTATDYDANAVLGRAEPIEINQTYVINMPDEGARRRHIQKQCLQAGLNPLLYTPPLPGDVELIDRFEQTMENAVIKYPQKLVMEISNRLAFGRIINMAIKNGYKNIIILEDDAEFIPGAKSLISKILQELPANYGICFLGGYIRDGIELEKKSENVAKISRGCRIWGSHAILLNESVFSVLEQEFRAPVAKNTDTILWSNNKDNSFIAVPIIAWQKGDVSTVQRIHKNFDFDYLRAKSEEYLKQALEE